MKQLLAIILALAPVSLAAQVKAPAVAETRMIAIEGSRNFRDAGGYQTADGRRVKMGRLYRSASLADLTPQGMSALEKPKIAAVIDLRSTDERLADSNNWLAAAGLGYWTRDYAMEQMGMRQLFSDPAKLTPDAVRSALAEAYRSMPKVMAPSYRQLFDRLGNAGRGAVVVNCTAGKDRTGIATALVLTALGVPYETVREDFLLSNAAARSQFHSGVTMPPAMAAVPRESLALLAGVDGSWLDAAFDQMRKDHGSIEGWLKAELDVGPEQITALKQQMLE
jgi:protein-tyrosine phosphatase